MGGLGGSAVSKTTGEQRVKGGGNAGRGLEDAVRMPLASMWSVGDMGLSRTWEKTTVKTGPSSYSPK